MPPKKAKTTAKAKAVSKTPTRSTSTAAPATVVTNRGKEYDTTAAAARPRRAIAQTTAAPVKAPVQSELTRPNAISLMLSTLTRHIETSNATTATKKRGKPAHVTDEAVEPPKKRGRPAHVADGAVEPPKKRGRPARAAVVDEEVDDVEEEEAAAVVQPKKRGRPAKSATTITSQPTAKKAGRPAKATVAAAEPKKRGRPAKVTSEAAAEEGNEAEEADEDAAKPEAPKKRGRPAKKQAAPAPAKQTATAQSAKKRGRPSKVTADPAENPAEPDTPAPRKRHSGRFGGPTTKISTDAADAAEQLEDELIGEAERSVKKSGKGKPSSGAKTQDANESGKNYWLMKAEQVDRMETLQDGSEFNTKFTIDDLKSKGAPEPWEGVRNMVARNNMRAMKQGDLAFFYASQGKSPGITGIIEIVQEHEPDFTVEDEGSIGYVEPAKRGKENQWSLVHVGFLKKLSKPVTLKELQKYSGANGILQDMQVIKQSRLSVAKVSEKEWNFIVDNLIEGYEEDDDDNNDDDNDKLAGVQVGGDKPLDPDLNGGQAIVRGYSTSPAPDGVQATAGAKKEEPEDVLSGLPAAQATNGDDDSDEMLMSGATAPFTSATARSASQHSSRPASRTGQHMAVSRQGSLAPPVLQTTEASMDVTMTESHFEESVVAEPTRAVSRNGSEKPGVPSRASSRASSRAPSVARSRASSRAPSHAPSLKSVDRGNSLEPSARPGSRGTMNLMPSLMESPVDA